MVLSNFQGSFNGLTWGPGTDVQLQSLEGLRALPGIRGGDVSKPREEGSFAGLNFMGERIITIKLLVSVTSTPFETVIANVANAFQNISNPSGVLPFQFMLPAWSHPKQVYARPTKAEIPVDTNYNYHRAEPLIELTCPDPRIYDTVPQTASSGLPSPTAGLMFPVTFPATFGASTGGSMQVTNSGNYPAPVVFTITGPCTNPILSFQGMFFKLNLSLGASDTITIDMGQKTVTLNGAASRSNTVATGSSWFSFPPGTWSVGVGSSDSAAVAANFTATWASTWGWI